MPFHRVTRREVLRLGATGALLSLSPLSRLSTACPNDAAQDFIPVLNPRKLRTNQIPAQRIPVGAVDDYKPCIAILPSGELLLVAFHNFPAENKRFIERILLFRSRDGGKTWTGPETLDLPGREPYLTVLRDGTIFITVHFLPGDIRNKDNYTHAYVHRSADGGKTWTSQRIGPEGFPPKAETLLSRDVVEMPDGTLLLGVDYPKGPVYLWRSKDRGVTWDRTLEPSLIGWHSGPGESMFYGGEGFNWVMKSGKLLAVTRVNSDDWPMPGKPQLTGQKWDHTDRMLLWESTDQGRTFRKVQDLGTYAEMYPSILRLRDGRLLFTFTVRDLNPPLGVQAVLGVETKDGVSFDFDHDRFLLDTKTPKDKPSGGGFGPTVQTKDGTLVTSYSYRDANNKTHLEVVRWRLPK